MVSREKKRAALHEKLQLLRSITNSHALNKTSIIVDASKYIEELKQKLDKLNQNIAATQTSTSTNGLPMVTVETLEKGFMIDVFSDRSCPGLLVPILEAFEELGLNVLEARVSCTDSFRLQAVGGELCRESRIVLIAGQATSCLLTYLRKYLKVKRNNKEVSFDKKLIAMRLLTLQNATQNESFDAPLVKQAVLQAIDKWSESTNQQE